MYLDSRSIHPKIKIAFFDIIYIIKFISEFLPNFLIILITESRIKVINTSSEDSEIQLKLQLEKKDAKIEEMDTVIKNMTIQNKKLEKVLNSKTPRSMEDYEHQLQELKDNHKTEIQEMRQKYEQTLHEITELHKQEKSLLIDKLENKQTFTFGERSKKNQEVDTQSTCSLRDEIDKLNFIIEEKDYMNAELKQQIILLKER